MRADGTRVSPLSTACGTDELAIRRATEANIDRIDRIERPEWFTVSGGRKVRYPREKSPALHQARAAVSQGAPAEFHATAGYQRFAEAFND